MCEPLNLFGGAQLPRVLFLVALEGDIIGFVEWVPNKRDPFLELSIYISKCVKSKISLD